MLAAIMAVVFLAVVGLFVVGALRAQKQRADLAWVIIDPQGQQVGAPQFDDAEPFSHGLAAVKQDGAWGFVDTTGALVISPTYTRVRPFEASGRARVQQESMWGLIGRDGSTVLEPSLTRCGPFEDGVAAATISVGQSNLMANRRSDLDYEPSTGLLLPDGTWRVPPAERDAPGRWRWARGPADGLVAVEVVGGDWRLFDLQGHPIGEARFAQLERPSGGRVPAREGKAWGYVDATGTWVIEPQWTSAQPFSEWVAVVRKNASSFLIGPDGQRIAGPFEALRSASEGLVAARRERRWGFIDTGGSWVIKPRFDDVGGEGFQDGYARVGRYAGLDMEWAWIDANGEILGDLWASALTPRAEGLGWARISRRSEEPL